jgi:hypothetical protein
VPGGGVNAYAYPPDPVNMNDYSGMVGTADSYSAWKINGAKPTLDANLRPRPSNWAKSTAGHNASIIASGVSAAFGVAAMVMLTVNPVGLAAVILGFGVASTAIGLIGASIDCSADPASFECIAGLITSAAGMAGASIKAGGFAAKIAGGAIEGTATWVDVNLFGISLLRNSAPPKKTYTKSR